MTVITDAHTATTIAITAGDMAAAIMIVDIATVIMAGATGEVTTTVGMVTDGGMEMHAGIVMCIAAAVMVAIGVIATEDGKGWSLG